MNNNYLMTLTSLIIGALLSFTVQAELKPMSESSLSDITAQSGVTLSGQIDIKQASISYINEGAESVGTDKNWLVVNDMNGKVEFKNAMIDLENGYGTDNKGAIKITLPESVEFKKFKVGGLYLGPGKDKSTDHRYLLGLRINGKLNMPTQPKAYMFVK